MVPATKDRKVHVIRVFIYLVPIVEQRSRLDGFVLQLDGGHFSVVEGKT